MNNTTNKYISTEALRFVVKSEGNNSADAYERHCEIISRIIDLVRKEGASIDEDWNDSDYGTKIYRIEPNGNETEVSGWIEGEDEPSAK